MANKFVEPATYKFTINDDKGKLGELLIRPNTVAWKDANQQEYKSVTLKQFTDWITNPATKTKTITQ